MELAQKNIRDSDSVNNYVVNRLDYDVWRQQNFDGLQHRRKLDWQHCDCFLRGLFQVAKLCIYARFWHNKRYDSYHFLQLWRKKTRPSQQNYQTKHALCNRHNVDWLCNFPVDANVAAQAFQADGGYAPNRKRRAASYLNKLFVRGVQHCVQFGFPSAQQERLFADCLCLATARGHIASRVVAFSDRQNRRDMVVLANRGIFFVLCVPCVLAFDKQERVQNACAKRH